MREEFKWEGMPTVGAGTVLRTQLQTSGANLRLLKINEVKTGNRMREELKREHMKIFSAGTVSVQSRTCEQVGTV